MADTPTLDDFPSEGELPEELDDDFMVELHALSVDGIDIEDATDEDAPHGENTEEEMI